ncbi:MAG TPA: hypothetical protein PJ982_11765, partial [Lacipirellulaceae bacterium]|nr:hypothetical protein [Lacipirellulaceae bacterium]
HISNKHLKLEGVVHAAAQQFDLDAALVDADAGEKPPIGSRSRWILLHRRHGYFAERQLGVPLAEVPTAEPLLWTDDFNNLVDVLQ